MVYETYETDCFVLSARNSGEGNRIFSLFTKDFGLIQAAAQSVRNETSKLRYNLQVFSRASVSVVRGREYFRIVGARDADHFFVAFGDNSEKVRLLRRLFNLLLRLVHGEGANAYLYSVLEGLIVSLKEDELTSVAIKRVELLTVARMLYALGYFSDREKYADFFVNGDITLPLLAIVAGNDKNLLADINQSLSESHL